MKLIPDWICCFPKASLVQDLVLCRSQMRYPDVAGCESVSSSGDP